jgi:taurine transport system substrate-binding protein
MTSNHRFRLVAAAGVALVALAACGSDSKTSSTTGAPAATTVAAATTTASSSTSAAGASSSAEGSVPPASTSASSARASADVDAAKLPKKIRIAYQQIPNGDLIVKDQKWLETAFGPDVEVEWSLFASGGDVNQAVLADAVDIGLVGSSPASRGISSGIEYRVPWIFDVIGSAEALVAKAGINTIADLKGKTVATPFASTSHFSLLAALDAAGVAQSDVKIIDAEPDAIYAGWSAGQIDAAYVWNPNLAKLVDAGGKVLTTSADLAATGKTTYDLAVVTNDFANEYPDAVNIWAQQQDRAVKLIESDPAQAATSIATELNISPDEATAQMAGLEFLTAADQVGPDYLGGGLSANLLAAAKFNQTLGEIESVQPDDAYTAAVDDQFAKSVGG